MADENVINWRNDADEDEDEELLLPSVQTRSRIPPCFRGLTHYHFSVFLLTFSSYALFHATRKNLSTVKSRLAEEWTDQAYNESLLSSSPFRDQSTWHCDITDLPGSKRKCLFSSQKEAIDFEGVLDACFLTAYAVGLYISGILGDRFDPRVVLSIGMWLSAILVMLFGCVSEWLLFYNKAFYVTLWLASGLIQSLGWPTEVAIVGNWFGRGSRGLFLGIWSSCASVGNIIGTEISAAFLSYGYEYTFLANASTLFCGGFVIFFGLVTAPRDVGLPDPEEEVGNKKEPSQSQARPEPISFFRAVLLPGVIFYSLAYACLKLVNYSLFFWLPLYLKNHFGWDDTVSDQVSVWYDWGGIVGGIIGGAITDCMRHRTPMIIGLLLCSIGALFGYANSPKDETINGLLLGVAGFFIGGPANLISAAVTADLGRQPQIRGNAEALGTVTGIIDGTGSVGAAIGQVLVPAISHAFHWSAVFYLFMIMTICTALCLLPLLVNEIREWMRERKEAKGPAYRRINVLDDASIGDGGDIFGEGTDSET